MAEPAFEKSLSDFRACCSEPLSSQPRVHSITSLIPLFANLYFIDLQHTLCFSSLSSPPLPCSPWHQPLPDGIISSVLPELLGARHYSPQTPSVAPNLPPTMGPNFGLRTFNWEFVPGFSPMPAHSESMGLGCGSSTCILVSLSALMQVVRSHILRKKNTLFKMLFHVFHDLSYISTVISN